MTATSHSPSPWRGALGLALLSLAGFGLLYSLAGVGLAQAIFPEAASGSLVRQDERVVGSALVAQPFTHAGDFQPRPSAAGYQPMAAAGSNQAQRHPDLAPRLAAAREAIARRDGVAPQAVPDDLVTQSGSGLDPHISPAGAAVQIRRVAQARGLDAAEVTRLVQAHTTTPPWGVPGAAHVDVLRLNLALDARTGVLRDAAGAGAAGIQRAGHDADTPARLPAAPAATTGAPAPGTVAVSSATPTADRR